MFLPPKILGAILGLAAAALALWILPQPPVGVLRSGPPLSECDGAIQSIVIQYAPSADFALPVYRQFLRQLPSDVNVYVMCPDRSAYKSLLAGVGHVPPRLRPVIVAHEMTCWSRDRWIAFEPCSPGGPAVLLAPRGEAAAECWPQREGDQRLAFDLSDAFPGRIAARRSSLYFDAGDFLADGRSVFVTVNVIQRNLQNTVFDLDQLRREIQGCFPGRKVVLLENSPDHHAGMFMMSIGDNTALVGDPSLARAYPHPDLPGGPDFSNQTQARFDSVAKDAAAAGYRVIRIPVIPASDGKTFLTYVNAIIDQRDG